MLITDENVEQVFVFSHFNSQGMAILVPKVHEIIELDRSNPRLQLLSIFHDDGPCLVKRVMKGVQNEVAVVIFVFYNTNSTLIYRNQNFSLTAKIFKLSVDHN